MLLVIDVGNTNTVLGIYHEGELEYHWRIETSRHKTEDEFGMLLRSLFDYVGLMFDQIEGIIISSVVPPIMFSSKECVLNIFRSSLRLSVRE